MGDFFDASAMSSIRAHVLPGVWPLLVAFAVCALVVPLMIWLSPRTGLMARPGGRHAHPRATPTLGGVAMFAGFAVALLVFLPRYPEMPGIVVVSAFATALLIVDDRWQVRPLVKLAFQLFIALLAVGVFGIRIGFISLPGGHIVDFALPVAVVVSVFWLLGMQNTVNFLDGADGLASGVICIVALILMLAAGELNQIDVVRLAGALAGCCAGFLVFNFHPARIFMGDSGAHFLGIALGMISIVGVAKVAVAFALAAPVLALALPIADTAWAILRRRLARASVARPDTLHLHHRLQSFGLDPRQTCYVFYTATALLGAGGLTLFGHGRVFTVVAILAAAATSTVAADLLLHARLRLPAPWLARLLGEQASH